MQSKTAILHFVTFTIFFTAGEAGAIRVRQTSDNCVRQGTYSAYLGVFRRFCGGQRRLNPIDGSRLPHFRRLSDGMVPAEARRDSTLAEVNQINSAPPGVPRAASTARRGLTEARDVEREGIRNCQQALAEFRRLCPNDLNHAQAEIERAEARMRDRQQLADCFNQAADGPDQSAWNTLVDSRNELDRSRPLTDVGAAMSRAPGAVAGTVLGAAVSRIPIVGSKLGPVIGGIVAASDNAFGEEVRYRGQAIFNEGSSLPLSHRPDYEDSFLKVFGDDRPRDHATSQGE